MAKAKDLQALSVRTRRQQAVRLRPSLAGTEPKNLRPADIGWVLGALGKGAMPLLAGFEDVGVAIMAPRSGKTTAYGVPLVLDAPGAVIATSNKADLWAATAALRAQDTGERVWVFDPQGIAHAPRTWWWNPLAAVNSVEEAERLASHFVLTVEGKDGDIWGPAGASLLSTLIMAAKVSGGTLLDVYAWLNDDSDPTPGTLLRRHGHPLLAKEFEGTRTMAHETRASVYFTARTATKCLRNPQITSWVTPPLPGEDVEEIDTAAFPLSRQTLYLLSKDGGGSAAPLVAALTDRMMREGVQAAELRGGRLDPPMMVLLDEAANICRIGDLPSLYSHLGSRGVIPLTILQSYAQGVRVWGDTGMKALWGAATVKVIGSGIDDASFADDLSRLIGDHDVTVASVSYSEGRSEGRRTRSRSPQQRRILPASEIRALPKGRVLVMTTGA
nr:type IV secretory system conjugative DNA transfer family protein [Motilibacter deserti]